MTVALHADSDFKANDVVIDADNDVAQKVSDDSWTVMDCGMYRFSDLVQPLRRLAVAVEPVERGTGPDTRVFRMTRKWGGYNRRTDEFTGRIEYGDRKVASAKCGAGGHSHRYGSVVKVEATNPEATAGWTDVTEEFLGVRVAGDVL